MGWEGGGRGKGRGCGEGWGVMTQSLYAHMNKGNKNKYKERNNKEHLSVK
jgi:hypothetical protein